MGIRIELRSRDKNTSHSPPFLRKKPAAFIRNFAWTSASLKNLKKLEPQPPILRQSPVSGKRLQKRRKLPADTVNRIIPERCLILDTFQTRGMFQDFENAFPVYIPVSGQVMLVSEAMIIVQMAVHQPWTEFLYQILLPLHRNPQILPDRRHTGSFRTRRSFLRQVPMSGIIAQPQILRIEILHHFQQNAALVQRSPLILQTKNHSVSFRVDQQLLQRTDQHPLIILQSQTAPKNTVECIARMKCQSPYVKRSAKPD